MAGEKKRAVVSLSGGMDSAVLLASVLKGGGEVIAVGFSYGSKHNFYENLAAYNLAAVYKIPFRRLDLTPIMENFKSDLLKSGGEVPEGHYEADSMRRTVVPCRNMIFASILAGIAQSEGCCEMYLGVHAGDHHIYPDCRPNFIKSMLNAVYYATEGEVTLCAPFLYQDKTWILGQGMELGVPFAMTRTCYKDQPIACGKCGSCQERLTSFKNLGLEDPLAYESREILPK